jgi:hypothetical protein
MIGFQVVREFASCLVFKNLNSQRGDTRPVLLPTTGVDVAGSLGITVPCVNSGILAGRGVTGKGWAGSATWGKFADVAGEPLKVTFGEPETVMDSEPVTVGLTGTEVVVTEVSVGRPVEICITRSSSALWRCPTLGSQPSGLPA